MYPFSRVSFSLLGEFWEVFLLGKEENRACPISHISGRPARGLYFLANKSGKVLEVKAGGFKQIGGGLRGEISAWSSQSRTRLVKMSEAIEWGALGKLVFITLTYKDGPETGEECKKDLKMWYQRWRDTFGAARGMWKLEFQRRGIPHYHLLLESPVENIEKLRDWVARSWWEVVGSGDEDHLRAGTEVDWWRSDRSPGGYFAKYGMVKGKEYQNQVPEGWKPGRWWGYWGVSVQWDELNITQEEFWRLRRLFLRLKRSRGGSPRAMKRAYQGTWIRGEDLGRLVEWVRNL